MNRFSGIKCIHCGETIKRKSDIPAEPLNPKRTCLVCGQTTDLTKDIPLPEIKSISGKALNCLVKGQWKEGLELAKRTELLVTKHFSLPVLEWVEVQIAIYGQKMSKMAVVAHQRIPHYSRFLIHLANTHMLCVV